MSRRANLIVFFAAMVAIIGGISAWQLRPKPAEEQYPSAACQVVMQQSFVDSAAGQQQDLFTKQWPECHKDPDGAVSRYFSHLMVLSLAATVGN